MITAEEMKKISQENIGHAFCEECLLLSVLTSIELAAKRGEFKAVGFFAASKEVMERLKEKIEPQGFKVSVTETAIREDFPAGFKFEIQWS